MRSVPFAIAERSSSTRGTSISLFGSLAAASSAAVIGENDTLPLEALVLASICAVIGNAADPAWLPTVGFCSAAGTWPDKDGFNFTAIPRGRFYALTAYLRGTLVIFSGFTPHADNRSDFL